MEEKDAFLYWLFMVRDQVSEIDNKINTKGDLTEDNKEFLKEMFEVYINSSHAYID